MGKKKETKHVDPEWNDGEHPNELEERRFVIKTGPKKIKVKMVGLQSGASVPVDRYDDFIEITHNRNELIHNESVFRNFDHFEKVFSAWKKQYSHPMRVASSETLRECDGDQNEEFRYRYVVYHCAHFGEPRLRGSGIRPNQQYLPCGCRSMLRLTYSFKEQCMKITTLNPIHMGHDKSEVIFKRVFDICAKNAERKREEARLLKEEKARAKKAKEEEKENMEKMMKNYKEQMVAHYMQLQQNIAAFAGMLPCVSQPQVFALTQASQAPAAEVVKPEAGLIPLQPVVSACEQPSVSPLHMNSILAQPASNIAAQQQPSPSTYIPLQSMASMTPPQSGWSPYTPPPSTMSPLAPAQTATSMFTPPQESQTAMSAYTPPQSVPLNLTMSPFAPTQAAMTPFTPPQESQAAMSSFATPQPSIFQTQSAILQQYQSALQAVQQKPKIDDQVGGMICTLRNYLQCPDQAKSLKRVRQLNELVNYWNSV